MDFLRLMKRTRRLPTVRPHHRRRLLLEPLEFRRMLAPVVSSLTPTAASHSAVVSTDVEVTFTETLGAGTVTDQTFAVHGMQTGRLRTADSDLFSAAGPVATVNPADNFLPGEQIQATVTAGIQNGSGQAATPFVWQFRTRVTSGTGLLLDSGPGFGNSNSNDVQLGDFDGDGDLDAFVANFNEPNRVWVNQGGTQGGTPGAFSDSGLSLGVYASYRSSLGDVDGDGDLDAFVVNVGGQGNRVWINQGGSQPGPAGVFLDSSQSLGSLASRDVELGDVDGDGDLDAFVVNSYQSNRVWLNQGGIQGGAPGTFSDSNQTMGAAASYGLELGDLDGDGDLDAVVANLGVANRVWLNQGGAQSGAPGVFSDSGQSLSDAQSTGVSLGDVDHDGDLDAVVSNYFQGNRVWLNQGGSQGGTAGQFSNSGQSLGSFPSWGVNLGDLDGDGDLDAFVPNYNQGSRVWINQGGLQNGTTGTFADSDQSLGSFYSFGAALGDLDGDGDLDALVANYNQGNRVWINQNLDYGDAPDSFGTSADRDGARHVPAGPTLGLTRDSESSAQPTADATGDDVTNTGAVDDEDGVTFGVLTVGQLGAQVTVNVAGAVARLDAWIDFNKDGTFDGSGERIANSTAMVVGDNLVSFDVPSDAVSAQSLITRFRLSTAGGLGPRGAAVDGEVEDHTVTIAAPSGLGSLVDSLQSLGTFSSRDVSLGDLDADGDLDVFVANFTQANRVWINQGGSQGGTLGTFVDSSQTLGTAQSTAVSLGDVDGDGDTDALIANSNEADRVWINQGGSQSGSAGTFSDSGQILGTTTSLDVAVGDLDGDGDLDALFADYAGNRVWINQGGAQNGTAGTFSDSGQGLGTFPSYGISLGDLDADGDLDAFVANNGGNRIWINQGLAQGGVPGTFGDSNQSLGTSKSYGAVLGDLDGDGDLDAFVANDGQPNHLWINQGGTQGGTAGTFSDGAQSLGSFNSSELSLGDLDGDGDLDAFVVNAAAQGNRVWVNQGGAQGGSAGTFSDGSQSLGTFTSSSTSLGDVDGDGDLDAFVTNRNEGNRIWLNQGQPMVIEHGVNGIGNTNRSAVASAILKFDRIVTISNVSSLRIYNHTTNTPLNIAAAQLENNGSTDVTWNFSSVNFPAGYYTAELPNTGATSVSGVPLAESYTFAFHVLPGDSDGDLTVGFGDFGELAANFNTVGGPILGPGDMNADGAVNFTDFGILATGFNSTVSVASMDFGDAPQTGTAFPTTLPDGARHVLGSTLFLGAGVDGELDGQPDATATGDDNSGDDEDGISFAGLQAGGSATITATAISVGGFLNAWIDFSGDGDWDDVGEHVLVDRSLSTAVTNLTIPVPAGATLAPTFARFRLTASPGYSYGGLAPDGEVEDYQLTIAAAFSRSLRTATDELVGGQLWNEIFADKWGGAVTKSDSLAAAAPDVQQTIASPAAAEPAIDPVAMNRRSSLMVRPTPHALDDDLVDRVFAQLTDWDSTEF